MRSPKALPPSPVPSVTPGWVRARSRKLSAPSASMTSLGMIVIDFGVSAMSSVNFDDAERSILNGACASANGLVPWRVPVMTISSAAEASVAAYAGAAANSAAARGTARGTAASACARSDAGILMFDIRIPTQ